MKRDVLKVIPAAYLQLIMVILTPLLAYLSYRRDIKQIRKKVDSPLVQRWLEMHAYIQYLLLRFL